MRDLECLILGDDFTPAAIFEEALRAGLGSAGRSVSCISIDIETSEPSAVVSDEVDEAFGDIEEVADLAVGCELLVTTFAPVTSAVLDRARKLLAIACGRGGPVNINTAAASARGIPVLNAPGRNAQAVAEYTLAGIINLMRQIPQALDYVRDNRWRTPREDTFEKPSGPELGARTLGLIGCGQVGRLVGRLAGSFGARVLAHDPLARRTELVPLGIEAVSLDRLLAEADIISLHARLARDAAPILGEAEFAAMTRRPYLVNTARAAAVDHDALLAALERGRIAGALLDVHPEEPLSPDSPLLAVDETRLLLTPHAAGISRDVPANTAHLLVEGLARLLQGRRPDHVINPRTLDTCFQRMGFTAPSPPARRRTGEDADPEGS